MATGAAGPRETAVECPEPTGRAAWRRRRGHQREFPQPGATPAVFVGRTWWGTWGVEGAAVRLPWKPAVAGELAARSWLAADRTSEPRDFSDWLKLFFYWELFIFILFLQQHQTCTSLFKLQTRKFHSITNYNPHFNLYLFTFELVRNSLFLN